MCCYATAAVARSSIHPEAEPGDSLLAKGVAGLTQEQAQKKAEGLNRKAQRLGLPKRYVVISTCTMGFVVAERRKL
jgi:hypothetical protein